MPDYQIQHPLADAFQHAMTQPQGEFVVACAVSEFIAEASESPEALFSEVIQPFLSLEQKDVQTLLNWFQEQGFTGPQNTVTIAHSDLNFVLEYRQGIPISLAVLILETARRAGFSSFGVNFPGHFLLSIEGSLIDPLSCSIVEDSQLAALTAQVKENPQKLLQPASVQMVGLRMLNNVKAQYVAQTNFAKALEVVDLQLACSAGQPELASSLHFERGEYWQQLGLSAAARDAYLICAQICPYPHLANKAQALADQLSGNDETFH